MDFRIKEVPTSIKAPTKVTERLYYPQAWVGITTTKGFWWWEKEEVNYEWQSIYRLNSRDIWKSDKEVGEDIWKYKDKIICFDTIGKAREWLDEFEKDIDDRNQKFLQEMTNIGGALVDHDYTVHSAKA